MLRRETKWRLWDGSSAAMALRLLALIALLLSAAPLRAQLTIEFGPGMGDSIRAAFDSLDRLERPDFSISAALTARELVIDHIGKGTLSFNYNGEKDTLLNYSFWNIPVVPMPNVTYKNIGILFVAESMFRDVFGPADSTSRSPDDR